MKAFFCEERSETLKVALLSGVLLLVLGLMFLRCGTDPNFWFDESGQFWMSKGQNHYSLPFTPDGTLADAIRANNSFNMDPGGYTLALRCWMSLGCSPGWLRFFSFTFFVLTMAACAGTAYLWTKDRLCSVVAGLIPALNPIVASLAFELRPYSMEASGTALSVLLLEKAARRDPGLATCFAMGLVSALFLTSRYSFVSTVAATGIGLLWIVRNLDWRSKAKLVAAFCLPLLITSAAIYWITLSHQNPGSAPPFYVDPFILHGKTPAEMLRIATAALFNPYGLGSTVFVASYLAFRWFRVEAAQYQRFSLFFLVSVSINVIFIFLSWCGKYPWGPQTRWGITQTLLAFLSWLPTVWMVSHAAGLAARMGRRALIRNACYLLLVLATLVTAVTIRKKPIDTIYANITALGPSALYGKRVLVVPAAQASLRYLYEYGPLKHNPSSLYPGTFIFEDRNSPTRELEQYDYIIYSHMLPEEIDRHLGNSRDRFTEISKVKTSPIYKLK